MNIKFIIILFAFLFTACSSVSDKTDGQTKSSREISELESAPQNIIIDNKTYVLEPYLWRDLMPVVNPKEKKGLLISIKFKTQDGTPVNEKIKASLAWVIKGTEIWETPIASTETKGQSFIEFYAKNGPEWKPEEKVDVIIELDVNNNKYLLQSKDQIIQAVY